MIGVFTITKAKNNYIHFTKNTVKYILVIGKQKTLIHLQKK